ncbi:winged helix-turn-helix transcriptional regulator [Nonomuraea ferruginea]|uniref:Helix-turn-helix domain-containing protein n=1 Tax=Nonomuraea ferruginea TaxID=46174 RepID=A0ABT4T7U6_9ACTN|nr:helix-turn-helix domain-containing protein [Nonomuraea ferruginea]MDA0645505.1 helix-turn-helix domain-containing protein [Nonomuraea ferruginea]
MRTYDDPCGVARALDHVGERWALLIVRELLLGPKRFTDLRAGLPGASQNVLSQRLRELEESGVLRRRKLPPPAASRVYELTERGSELEPVVLALAQWGSRMPLTSTGPLSVDALLYALKSTFDPGAADGFEGSVELRLGEESILATVSAGQLTFARDGAGGDAVLRADAETIRSVVFAGRNLEESEVEGDRQVAERFVTLFPRPPMSP